MKDILIIAHFAQVNNLDEKNRFNFIARRIHEKKQKVELVTSSFSHTNKKQKIIKNDSQEKFGYIISTIKEPGYNKNVSLDRLYSHYQASKSLKQYLKNRKKPDVIYCAVPSLGYAKEAAKFAKKNNIKFIIDIQDLWPEAFEMVLKVPILSKILFLPMKIRANYVYKAADEVIAVSKTYVKRALKENRKLKKGHDIFLGTELKKFDGYIGNNNNLKQVTNEIRIVYIGTLGHSYDLTSVIDAIWNLKKKGINNLRFVVMGDGPLLDEFKKYAEQKKIKTEFTGRLEYPSMVTKLSQCDIAVNPISKGAAQSIINKVGDYAAAALPVLNTQENTEYRHLVDKNKIGFNCKNNNSKDLAKKMLTLYRNPELRKHMGRNNRLLAEEKFDRDKTYPKIVELIEK